MPTDREHIPRRLLSQVSESDEPGARHVRVDQDIGLLRMFHEPWQRLDWGDVLGEGVEGSCRCRLPGEQAPFHAGNTLQYVLRSKVFTRSFAVSQSQDSTARWDVAGKSASPG